MRRSASSIGSNIAEGCGRDGDPELARFLSIALGSASELEYQLLLARDLGYLKQADYDEYSAQIVEVKRMLGGLMSRLKGRGSIRRLASGRDGWRLKADC
jgi:four helix bundle protein